MTDVLIRNVPDEQLDRIRLQAERNGQSVQAYLLSTLIELAGKPSVAEWVDAARARRARYGVGDTTTADVLAAIATERR
jgi:antitoxin FitA